jgi:phage shock protein PspC (stress-responsive transcriptional regulator)
MAQLFRPTSGRVIAGVCAAIANRFGWNVTLVRVLAVLSILLPGPQVIAYIVAWILIPAQERAAASAEPTTVQSAAGQP